MRPSEGADGSPPRFGRYEVQGELGRGGMGVVFEARSPEGDDVAIKVLKRLDARRMERFDRERRLLARFRKSDGFVPLLDAGTSPEGPFLVMPRLRGGTLRDRLERGRLGIDETIEIGRALARALGCAHVLGIVHRDVKPENAIFDETGRPLLSDLGLAKHFDREEAGAELTVSLTARGVIYGTPGYMAPEQILDAKSVGPAADVFALGAVLYECLTGKPVCEGDNFVEIFANTKTRAFTPARRLRSEVPVWLDAVVERALARDPKARFENGAALLEALERPRSALAFLWRRGKKWVAAGLAGAIVVAVVGGVLLARRLEEAETRTRRDLAMLERNAFGRATAAEVTSGYGALLAQAPRSVVPEVELSWAEFAARRGSAADSVEHARRLDGLAGPVGLEAKRLVADGLCRLGKESEAAPLLRELETGTEPVLQDWARLRRFTGHRAQHPEDVAAAIVRARGDRDASSFLLIAEIAALDTDSAAEEKALGRTLELAPDDVRALLLEAAVRRSGRTLAEIRDKDRDARARDELDAALRIGSPSIARSPLAAYLRGVTELAEGHMAAARADLDVAIEGGVEAPDVFVFRGWFEDEHGRRARVRGEELLKDRAAAFQPGLCDDVRAVSCPTPEVEKRLEGLAAGATPAARAPLATAILASARGEPFDDVKTLFDAAARAGANDPIVARERARFHLSRGRLPEAVRIVSEERGTKDPELLLVGMEAQRRRGRYEDACDVAQEIRTLDATGKCGHLAASYMAQMEGDQAGAQEHAEDAVTCAPEDGWARAAHVECLRLRDAPKALLDEGRAALGLQGCLDMEVLVSYVKTRMMLMPSSRRSSSARGARVERATDGLRLRATELRTMTELIVREAPSTDHHLLRTSAASVAEDQASMLDAARRADPGSPLVEDALGYSALSDTSGTDLTSGLAGGELRLPGMGAARSHFQAAREIDPRWWMSRSPDFPVPAEYRATATPLLEKSLVPLRTEFARIRR